MDNPRELILNYLRTLVSVAVVEAHGLFTDIGEMNICHELGETSFGIISLFAKAGHLIVKRLLINTPIGLYETTVKAINDYKNPVKTEEVKDTDKTE